MVWPFLYYPGLSSDFYSVLKISWSFWDISQRLFISFNNPLFDLRRSRKSITVGLWSKAVIAAVVFVAHLHFSPLGVDGRIELDIIDNCYCIRGIDNFLGPL